MAKRLSAHDQIQALFAAPVEIAVAQDRLEQVRAIVRQRERQVGPAGPMPKRIVSKKPTKAKRPVAAVAAGYNEVPDHN